MTLLRLQRLLLVVSCIVELVLGYTILPLTRQRIRPQTQQQQQRQHSLTTRPTTLLLLSADNDDDVIDDTDLDQFERDLLEAFGKEDQDDAVNDAAFSAFTRDLRPVEEWELQEDEEDGDDTISPEEALELYTSTLQDLSSSSSPEVDLEQYSVDVPEEEAEYVQKMIDSTKETISEIWGPDGMTNPVRDYFDQVKKQNDEEEDSN